MSWRLRLSEFYFEVSHEAGITYQADYALSCMPTTGMDETPLEDNVLVVNITKAPQKDNRQKWTHKRSKFSHVIEVETQ